MRFPMPTLGPALALAFALVGSAACSGNDGHPHHVAGRDREDADVRMAMLATLIDAHWASYLRDWPEHASFGGDDRGNARWGDASPDALARQDAEARALLAQLQALDDDGFSDTARTNRWMLIDRLEGEVAAYRLGLWMMPLDQFRGMHLALPAMAGTFPFASTRHYEDYAARLEGLPAVLAAITERARLGMRAGLVPPRHLMDALVAQTEAIAAPAGLDNAFAGAVRTFPDSVPQAEHARLRDAVLAAIDAHVRPAYRDLARFIETEYAAAGRLEPGIWSLPNGEALYLDQVRRLASTDMAPADIHALGLREVARIEAEMTRIAHDQGHPDLASMRAAMRDDRTRYATSREQLLDLYRHHVTRMAPRLHELFGLLPEARVDVAAVPAHSETTFSAAAYVPGTPDGHRPGTVLVNTGDFASRSLSTVEATAYHEGIPGHHMQMSIARALPDLPAFRTRAVHLAFVEGWALYSEHLAKELGFYEDPDSDYGRLAQALTRANRLVLDTGVHHLRWDRARMVAWLRTHSDADEPDLQAEVDRYIVWPGQGLAYKIGELKLIELRQRAQQALGAGFDLRGFHDTVLGSGSMPLSLLEVRIDRWIAQQQMAEERPG
ncbi:DUF885 domain-containing protein [Luteimonas abyssi]|uniref:DUF885 domain-containing protein n=1 Tax=Luteimonas abyssi TaxID=1247514 RepID=UPI000737C71B|nr:DUF885 domain-containing protein [Luteimonas abyssi]